MFIDRHMCVCLSLLFISVCVLLPRYERRGWVTYSHTIDIREVTARLTTNKVYCICLHM